MSSADVPNSADDAVIAQFLLEKYGSLLGRQALAEVLRFPTPEAFDRHLQRGHLDLPVVKFQGRRGVYVLATDVARYLVRSSRSGEAATA
ncbi:hypothetical protein ASD88_13260 [Pelomonas sp. Root662]|nr:hypothetical protein ASC81_13260 [Pelomonas sp. Root405]KRA72690.1 hypothetical protein ASD88_13260 [Pelomonas sp. Root662]